MNWVRNVVAMTWLVALDFDLDFVSCICLSRIFSSFIFFCLIWNHSTLTCSRSYLSHQPADYQCCQPRQSPPSYHLRRGSEWQGLCTSKALQEFSRLLQATYRDWSLASWFARECEHWLEWFERSFGQGPSEHHLAVGTCWWRWGTQGVSTSEPAWKVQLSRFL